MLRQMLPLSAVDALPQGLRLVVIDASSIQAPGPRALIIASILRWTWCPCGFCSRYWSAMSTRVKHSNISPWLQGMVLADRGYAQCQGMRVADRAGPSSSYGSIPLAWS